MHDDEDTIWASINGIYDAFIAGDRSAIDALIADDATVWDASDAPLLRGKRELDALRDTRPTDGPVPTALVASDQVIDVYGDVAVARYVLTVRHTGQPDERIRNTSVWRRTGDRWLCVHNHEDLLAGNAR